MHYDAPTWGQMSNSVTIRVPARLHLGFLDPNGESGRRFGSIGLPLSEPETVVTLSRAQETVVEGPESGRAACHLATLCEHLGIRSHHRLVVEQAIPRHAGLGSGTQIALAVAAALRTLHGLPLDIAGDATRLARGARSGIGIASFESGGVIIDAGKGSSGRPPPVVARLAFPEEWRVILILDPSRDGLHGEDEIEAFRSLPPFPASGIGEICRHVLMGVMPALVERDLAAFGAAISAIQMLVGNYFAPAQGGVFTSEARCRGWRIALPKLAQSASARARGDRRDLPSRLRRKRPAAWWPPTGNARGNRTEDRAGRNAGAKISATGLGPGRQLGIGPSLHHRFDAT